MDAASDVVISAAVDALTDPESEPAAALQQAVEQGDPSVLLPDIPDGSELADTAMTEVAAGAAGQLLSRGAGQLVAATRGGWGGRVPAPVPPAVLRTRRQLSFARPPVLAWHRIG